ncbi:MAG: AI-2E family transporter [Holosporaceae bacterium]|jgi:predicted PurR-regulated permease PerM|nr:AI-2E family transporter [Holosporaceae bacterium]
MTYLTDSRSVFWICTIGGVFLFFYLFSEICFPFVVGFFLAYFSSRCVDSLSFRYLPRGFISALFALSSVGIVILAGVIVLPKIKDCLILLHNNIPTYYSELISFLNNSFSSLNIDQYHVDVANLEKELQEYLSKNIFMIGSLMDRLASTGNAIRNFVSFFLIMPISFFYFLRDWNKMTFLVRNCLPSRQREIFVAITVLIRTTFQKFFNGQFKIALVLALFYATSLYATGLSNYILLGITSGMSSFVPFVGAFFSFLLVILINAPLLTLAKMYLLIAIYMVGQFLESYLLYPHFVGKKVGLHPLWMMFSFFAGLQLGGIVGVLIAIPLTSVLRSLISFFISRLKVTPSYKL